MTVIIVVEVESGVWRVTMEVKSEEVGGGWKTSCGLPAFVSRAPGKRWSRRTTAVRERTSVTQPSQTDEMVHVGLSLRRFARWWTE
jgi:hypothetical protein